MPVPSPAAAVQRPALIAPPATGQQSNTAVLPTPPKPNPVPGSYVIALLKYCHDKTSVCHGCRGSLRDVNGAMPAAPRDIVIVSKGRREYTNPQGVKQLGNLSNIYFHFNTECVKLKNQYFVPYLCHVQDEVKLHLDPLHKAVLRSCNIAI